MQKTKICDKMIKVKKGMESGDSTKKIKIDVESKKEFKDENFAYQISKIREMNNMTQKELAEIIGVSDRTISKWENGSSVPDGVSIRKICNKLGISPSNLLTEKRTFKDYLRYGIKGVIKAFKYILHNIFLLIFIVLFILLLIYFINNYNAVSMYTITYNTKDDLSISRGYFIKNKVRNILLIDNIEITKMDYEIKDIELELFTLVNADKISIYTSDNLEDIFITELNNYPERLKDDAINSMKNNLHLEIKITDEDNVIHNYKANLILKVNFVSNKLSYENFKTENGYNSKNIYNGNKSLLDNTNYISLNLPNQKIEEEQTNIEEENIQEKLASIGYEYNNDTKTYIKYDGTKEIEYDKNNETLKENFVVKTYKYDICYYVNTKIVKLKINNANNIELSCNYIINNEILNDNNQMCDTYIALIKSIIQSYNSILTTLQS